MLILLHYRAPPVPAACTARSINTDKLCHIQLFQNIFLLDGSSSVLPMYHVLIENSSGVDIWAGPWYAFCSRSSQPFLPLLSEKVADSSGIYASPQLLHPIKNTRQERFFMTISLVIFYFQVPSCTFLPFIYQQHWRLKRIKNS